MTRTKAPSPSISSIEKATAILGGPIIFQIAKAIDESYMSGYNQARQQIAFELFCGKDPTILLSNIMEYGK